MSDLESESQNTPPKFYTKSPVSEDQKQNQNNNGLLGLKISNLSRPYNIKKLLQTIQEFGDYDSFWQNSMKSNCYFKMYSEEACDKAYINLNNKQWQDQKNELQVSQHTIQELDRLIEEEKQKQNNQKQTIKITEQNNSNYQTQEQHDKYHSKDKYSRKEESQDKESKLRGYNETNHQSTNSFIHYEQGKKIIKLSELKSVKNPEFEKKADVSSRLTFASTKKKIQLLSKQQSMVSNNSRSRSRSRSNDYNKQSYKNDSLERDRQRDRYDTRNNTRENYRYPNNNRYSRERQQNNSRDKSRDRLHNNSRDRYEQRNRYSTERHQKPYRERDNRSNSYDRNNNYNNNRYRNYDENKYDKYNQPDEEDDGVEKTVEELFIKTKSFPPIYYKPISEKNVQYRKEHDFVTHIKKNLQQLDEINEQKQRERFQKRPFNPNYNNNNHDKYDNRNYEKKESSRFDHKSSRSPKKSRSRSTKQDYDRRRKHSNMSDEKPLNMHKINAENKEKYVKDFWEKKRLAQLQRDNLTSVEKERIKQQERLENISKKSKHFDERNFAYSYQTKDINDEINNQPKETVTYDHALIVDPEEIQNEINRQNLKIQEQNQKEQREREKQKREEEYHKLRELSQEKRKQNEKEKKSKKEKDRKKDKKKRSRSKSNKKDKKEKEKETLIMPINNERLQNIQSLNQEPSQMLGMVHGDRMRQVDFTADFTAPAQKQKSTPVKESYGSLRQKSRSRSRSHKKSRQSNSSRQSYQDRERSSRNKYSSERTNTREKYDSSRDKQNNYKPRDSYQDRTQYDKYRDNNRYESDRRGSYQGGRGQESRYRDKRSSRDRDRHSSRDRDRRR